MSSIPSLMTFICSKCLNKISKSFGSEFTRSGGKTFSVFRRSINVRHFHIDGSMVYRFFDTYTQFRS